VSDSFADMLAAPNDAIMSMAGQDTVQVTLRPLDVSANDRLIDAVILRETRQHWMDQVGNLTRHEVMEIVLRADDSNGRAVPKIWGSGGTKGDTFLIVNESGDTETWYAVKFANRSEGGLHHLLLGTKAVLYVH